MEVGRIKWYPGRKSLLAGWSIVGSLTGQDCWTVYVPRVPAIVQRYHTDFNGLSSQVPHSLSPGLPISS